MAIMGRGMDFSVHAVSTAATLIGAGTITGTNQVCVEAAVSAATQVKRWWQPQRFTSPILF